MEELEHQRVVLGRPDLAAVIQRVLSAPATRSRYGKLSDQFKTSMKSIGAYIPKWSKAFFEVLRIWGYCCSGPDKVRDIQYMREVTTF